MEHEIAPLTEDDGFTVVNKKGRKRAATTASPPPPAKSACPPGQARSREPSPADRVVREKRPPPLLLHDKARWEAVRVSLIQSGIQIVEAHATRQAIKIQVASANDHRAITKYLRNEGIGFHTYALEEEKVLRVVIRGLPKEISTDLIKRDLVSNKYPVRETHRLYGRGRVEYDMVLVVLDRSPEGRAIFNLKTCCGLSGLSVETPHKNGTPPQCHRCQHYGHAARFCNGKPRCVKCLGDHGTSECARKRDDPTPPSCVLCGTQGHTANYRGCPKAPKAKKAPLRSGTARPAATRPATTRAAVAPAPAAPAAPVPSFTPAPPPKTNAWKEPRPKPLAPPSYIPPPSNKGTGDITALINLALKVDIEAISDLARKIASVSGNPALIVAIMAEHKDLVAEIKATFPALS